MAGAAQSAFAEVVNLACLPFASKPKTAIAYSWFASIVLVVGAFAAACAAADRHRGGGGAALGFAAVWSVLLCGALSVFGTWVLRQRQTEFAVGALIGIVVIIANQMLMLTAVFGSEANRGDRAHQKSADVAFAVFSYVLFLTYLLFAALLAVFRTAILAPKVPTHQQHPGAPASSLEAEEHERLREGPGDSYPSAAADDGAVVGPSDLGGGLVGGPYEDDFSDVAPIPPAGGDQQSSWHQSPQMFDDYDGGDAKGGGLPPGGQAADTASPLV
mmetsp:Transcript_17953/g.71962  ORF Transcript_17953/g.71962 Transcript_17953/m.71962 type:complete len:273 (+) Transcript_17953:102-920(+)